MWSMKVDFGQKTEGFGDPTKSGVMPMEADAETNDNPPCGVEVGVAYDGTIVVQIEGRGILEIKM